jgi:cell division septation protein DedD
MSDQSVREIQLNGKQLVFMFMTATVAAVVVFLCGVMVGRGATSTRASAAAAAVAAEPAVDPTSRPGTPATTASDTASRGEPVSAQGDLKDLTYARRLEAPEPPPEPAIESVPARAPAAVKPRVERSTPAPAGSKVISPVGEPNGGGFVVQVASLRSRDEADVIARRLSSKGYASFVTTPGADGPRVFRVRVGKFTQRSEAETVARRLEKEEQFKPWITR